MRLSQLEYDLPEELIATEPAPQRDQARMLVIERRTGKIEHSRFYKLSRYLREGDLLVLNNTRVLPARLMARKESGAQIELLMIRPAAEPAEAWLALARARRPLRPGTQLLLDNGRRLLVIGHSQPGRLILSSADSRPIENIMRESGMLALPHYIHRQVTAADADDYQTVFAEETGAIAAPTAGLHFTQELLQELNHIGVNSTFLTLHIGPGTFTPVRVPEIEQHSMEAEWYTIPTAALNAIELARRVGGRIIAVGTSSTRALESWAITGDNEGFTGLFISPGFRFRLVNAMITNFHMPRSTVLALVMALAGRETILNAYYEAIRHRYRFLSYGDSMLIL